MKVSLCNFTTGQYNNSNHVNKISNIKLNQLSKDTVSFSHQLKNYYYSDKNPYIGMVMREALESGNSDTLAKAIEIAENKGVLAEVLLFGNQKNNILPPLIYALSCDKNKIDNQKCISLLLKAGEDKGIIEKMLLTKENTATPLHYAASNGSRNYVSCLMALGKKYKILDKMILAKSENGSTPLHYAAITSKKYITELKNAAKEKRIKDKLLLETDKFGYSPLHYAVRYGNNDCVSELLKDNDKKIQKQILLANKTESKSTPLHLAMKYNSNTQNVEEFIKIGKNCGIINEMLLSKDESGRMPINIAFINGKSNFATLLADAASNDLIRAKMLYNLII